LKRIEIVITAIKYTSRSINKYVMHDQLICTARSVDGGTNRFALMTDNAVPSVDSLALSLIITALKIGNYHTELCKSCRTVVLEWMSSVNCYMIGQWWRNTQSTCRRSAIDRQCIFCWLHV